MTDAIRQDSGSSEDEAVLPFDFTAARGKRPEKRVTQSVAPESVNCETKFKALISNLEQDTSSSSITPEKVQDELDRYRIWAGNIGAKQPASSKMSLDWQTRDATELRGEILCLIMQLSSALDDLSKIVTKQSINRSRAIFTNDQSSITITESEELLRSISNTISSLFRMSLLIQKITPRDRFLKANTGVRKPMDPIYDIRHVGAKFPKLKQEGFKWLQDRLGHAITQRRQFFRYAKKHREKKSGIVEEGKIMSQWPGLSPQANTGQLSRLLDTGAESSWAPTSASTLQLDRLAAARLLLTAEQEDDTVSLTSFATSLGGNENKDHLKVPLLKKISHEAKEFECPYCCMIVSPKSQKYWQKHVFTDLRPYVCQYQDCDVELFSDRRAWFDHEISVHRSMYKCLFCSHQPFTLEDALRSHLDKQHKNLCPPSALESLVKACTQLPQSFPSTACFICHEWKEELRKSNPHIPEAQEIFLTAKQLRNHVAYHMEQLALFALPRGVEGDSDDDMESGHAVVSSKIQLLTIDGNSQEPSPDEAALHREDATKPAAERLEGQASLSTEAINALIATESKDEDAYMQRFTADTLDNQSSLPESAIDGLTTALKDEDAYIRKSAVDALGKQSSLPQSAIHALIAALKDEDASIRKSAVEALGKHFPLSMSAINDLVVALKDEDSSVRKSAAFVLGKQWPLTQYAIDTLIAALKDEDASVRKSAVDALGKQSSLPESAIDGLTAALKDEDASVRSYAAKALERSHLSTEAIDTLITYLHAEDKDMRRSAASILRRHSPLPVPHQQSETIDQMIKTIISTDQARRPKSRDTFEIAIICGLLLESAMVELALDKDWADNGTTFGKVPRDPNAYTTGVIAGHNVVLAYCPTMGSNPAAQVVSGLQSSFKGIKIAFVVGICGVNPLTMEQEEIVLGDCVISTSVVQVDYRVQGSRDPLHVGARLAPNIRALLTNLRPPESKLQLTKDLNYHLRVLQAADLSLKYPGRIEDRLFMASYAHGHRPPDTTCTDCYDSRVTCRKSCTEIGCEDEHLILRDRLRNDATPNIHFGSFASSDTILKSGEVRDAMVNTYDFIAFDMDAAGICKNFPTVIIKAACDYADTHRNTKWQRYAAAVAAAGIKAVLSQSEILGDMGSEVQENTNSNTLPNQLNYLQQ